LYYKQFMSVYSTISGIQKALAAKETTCEKLVQGYLDRIREKQELNAFLEVYGSEALDRARETDRKVAAGKAGRLAGLVLGIKDNICYKGHKVSAASRILEGFESLYSATAIERLLAEDAIIIGRLNCDEFAMGSSNENSAFGKVLNPLDTARVPGGSSGGSAAAVAADLCHAALGSDTGGSIRQPASFCGLVGLKPTYGRVSRYGLIAYASSFDQIGPLTKSVEDAALLLEIMAGKDPMDSTSSSVSVPAYSALAGSTGPKRIAYIKECIDSEGLDPEIRDRFNETLARLAGEGHTVEPVSFPYLEYMVPAYYVLTTAEASSNLSRFGGILYGYRSPNSSDIDSTFRKSRTEGFGEEVKRRIMLGTFVLSAGYYDAYYSKGQKVRRILQDKTSEILAKADFILTPTTPKTAFRSGDIKDPVTMYLEDIFTVQANLTGLPAISLPAGLHSNGMPYGFQLIGRKFQEMELMDFSKYFMDNAVITISEDRD
jgi:aspartyl-tRNA(Asn)/glutamyl-tRNA(Gln) amidotransferase subunit A